MTNKFVCQLMGAVVATATLASPAHAQLEKVNNALGALDSILGAISTKKKKTAPEAPPAIDPSMPRETVLAEKQGSADSSKAAVSKSSALNLDIAGIRLGMSVAEAEAAARAAGYTLRPRNSTIFPDFTWNDLIEAKVAERRGQKYQMKPFQLDFEAVGARKQTLDVEFEATPDGNRVSSVEYNIPPDQMTEDAFISSVASKYGANKYAGNFWGWCFPAGIDCFGKDPVLRASTTSLKFSLQLVEGQKIKEQRAGMFAAEVERRAPKDARGAF